VISDLIEKWESEPSSGDLQPRRGKPLRFVFAQDEIRIDDIVLDLDRRISARLVTSQVSVASRGVKLEYPAFSVRVLEIPFGGNPFFPNHGRPTPL
jgi:hypothetical protein